MNLGYGCVTVGGLGLCVCQRWRIRTGNELVGSGNKWRILNFSPFG